VSTCTYRVSQLALRLEVSVPDAHVDVMDGLAARASGSAGVRV
jgi:hypothetical protein